MPVIGDACHVVVMAGKAEGRRAKSDNAYDGKYAKSGSGPGREAKRNTNAMKRK